MSSKKSAALRLSIGESAEVVETNERRFVGGFIRLAQINILSQPRKTFEDIEVLAESIAHSGLLKPPVIARLTPQQAEAYLAALNDLWGTRHALRELTPALEDSTCVYYILIAGERRTRALRHLEQRGCEACRATYGEEEVGRCFERHFKSPLIEARICRGITAEDALDMQFSENTHHPVPAHEEANAYVRLFRLRRMRDAGYTLAGFARAMGRSPQTIKNALKFCLLPESIQKLVSSGKIRYGVALQLCRLQEAGIKEDDLHLWATNAVVSFRSVEAFQKNVTNYLVERQNGQLSLGEIFEGEAARMQARRALRQTAANGQVTATHQANRYLRTIADLIEQGAFGPDGNYSDGSPRRLILETVERLKATLPLLTAREKQRAENAVALIEERLALPSDHSAVQRILEV